MKKLLTIILFVTSFSFKQDAKVFVCVSESAYAYHKSKDCDGLAQCHHKVIEVSQGEAINKYHRKKCHICWK